MSKCLSDSQLLKKFGCVVPFVVVERLDSSKYILPSTFRGPVRYSAKPIKNNRAIKNRVTKNNRITKNTRVINKKNPLKRPTRVQPK